MLPLHDAQQHQAVGREPEHERRDRRPGDREQQDRPYVGEEAALLEGDPGGEDDGREQAVEERRGREAQRGREAREPDDAAGGDAEQHRRRGGGQPGYAVPLDEEGGDDCGDEQEPDEEELDLSSGVDTEVRLRWTVGGGGGREEVGEGKRWRKGRGGGREEVES